METTLLEINVYVLIVLLLGLILLSSFFSGSETALLGFDWLRLRYLARKGNRRAKVLERILRRKERLISLEATAELPTDVGEFRIHVYQAKADPEPHLALSMGIPAPSPDEPNPPIDEPVLVRAHSECLTGDLFHSRRCDCGEQLRAAQKAIAEAGRGVILYMRQEGRGIGLKNKIAAYKLQDEEGLDTVQANERLGFPADLRDYGVGAQILLDLGVRKLRLLTNNPGKRAAIEGYGLQIVERVPLEVVPNAKNLEYLRTKKEKLGHVLHLMS